MNTDFKKFINEVQTLEVKTKNGRLDLSHYRDDKYSPKIGLLQQRAINEVLDRNPEQISQHLRRIQRIKKNLREGNHTALVLSKEFFAGGISAKELNQKLLPKFLGSAKVRGQITRQFFYDLVDGISVKLGSLESFEDQINEVIDVPETGNKKSEIQPADKIAWIEQEWEKNGEDYKSKSEWADATSKKFKELFNTSQSSPGSMKRYAHYKGRK